MDEDFSPTQQDEATKNTAQDALFSKINSAKLGYFTDDYSQLFTKNKRKLMPIINRGTWTRVFSVRTLINNFLKMYEDTEVQIVSLGAGFDTNFFYYQENIEEFKTKSTKYFEVDFPDITAKKVEIIKENQSLENFIFNGEEPNYESEDQILAEKYKLIPCDIREIVELEEKLVSAGADTSTPTLILTECVLCYMDNDSSSRILKSMTSTFTTVAMVNFEMVNPNDPFGMTMVENLEARGCQLLGLKGVQDTEGQIKRLKDCGFTSAYSEDMLRIHNSKLDEDERARVENIEMFDEFEEWNLLQTHYAISIGSKLEGEAELTF